MKLKEALLLLDAAPVSDKPSKLNPSLTQSQAVKIVKDAVATLGIPRDKILGPEDEIDPLAEKRVHQVHRNQKRPKY